MNRSAWQRLPQAVVSAPTAGTPCSMQLLLCCTSPPSGSPGTSSGCGGAAVDRSRASSDSEPLDVGLELGGVDADADSGTSGHPSGLHAEHLPSSRHAGPAHANAPHWEQATPKSPSHPPQDRQKSKALHSWISGWPAAAG
eukprot:11825580-Alexandrium_andersonii.AAC.1